MFRTLYKLAFKTSSFEAYSNRSATVHTLEVLFHRYPLLTNAAFDEDLPHYNNIDLNIIDIEDIVRFFYFAPKLFNKLNEDVQELLHRVIKSNVHVYIYACFLSGSEVDS